MGEMEGGKKNEEAVIAMPSSNTKEDILANSA